MEPLDIGWAGDVVGVTARCSDVSIETLSRLGDHQIVLELEWQIELQQVMSGISCWGRGFPPTGSVDLQPNIRPGMIVHAYLGGFIAEPRWYGSQEVPGSAFV